MITIVSGLPRSGTSLTMQMLKNGGMEIMTDNVRKADDNNLRGYYEYEKVKGLKNNNSWIGEAENKAVKVISYLLTYLPADYKYQIIFMERDLGEVLSSQQQMLKNLNKKANPADLAKTFNLHLVKIKKWLSHQPNMTLLEIPYRGIIEHPLLFAEKINDFLDYSLSVEKMVKVVDPSLYRQRK